MTTGRKIAAVLLVPALVAGASLFTSALADTRTKLDAAKRSLAEAEARLGEATAAWQAAEAELATLHDQIASTRARIAEHRAAIQRSVRRIQERAVMAFETGPGGALDLLLSAGSFAEFSDRVEFLGSLTQGDSDLVAELEVEREELRRDEASLASAIERQAAATRRLDEARRRIQAETGRLSDLVARYQRQWKLEQLLGQSTNPGGAIQVCPVHGPNSFVDSFGDPRPGGRTHEGIDMFAAYGTPVVAVQPGRAAATANALGGNAVIVYGPGGDWTYYAHLSSYGQTGSVGVGTVIGYVGSTGDTNVNHLHFEYHPNGGAAVDPYQALLAVC